MNAFKQPKSYISRKPFYTLSHRQKRRIALLDRLNKSQKVKKQHVYKKNNSKFKKCSSQDFKSFRNQQNVFESDNVLLENETIPNNNFGISLNLEFHENTENCIVPNEPVFNVTCSQNSTNSINVRESNNVQDCNSKKLDDKHKTFQDFKHDLAVTFAKTKMHQTQQREVLKILKSHPCFNLLPSDPRTLMQTPRNFSGKIIQVPPGEYLDLGLENALIQILKKTPAELIPSDTLLVDSNMDGCQINKKTEIIPIQVRISNIPESDVTVSGIYKGRKKPIDVELFLKDFITEAIYLQKEGLKFKNKSFTVVIRLFSFDLVGRAFFLRHRSHVSEKPCSKCHVIGIKINGTMVYLGINHESRSDIEYILITDKKHHIEKSPLLKLGVGLSTYVPIDIMHCGYIGVHNKMLVAFKTGKYGKSVKLSAPDIEEMSKRLLLVAKYCPREFARLPEPLKYLSDFKATQHRQMLLYVDVSVFRGIVAENVYTHFLFLNTALRCLTFKNPTDRQLSFARFALNQYILDAPIIYDFNYMSLNVHSLSHLPDDVQNFGSLDDFAAWPYENNMRFFNNFLKKPGSTLQQIYLRSKEIEKLNIDEPKTFKKDSYVRLFNPSHEGPFPENVPNDILKSWKVYKNIEYKHFTLGSNLKDSTCMLQDFSICIVKNVFEVSKNLIYVMIKKFDLVEELFNVGISSTEVGTYKCSLLSNKLELIEHTYVLKKCYRMPFWNNDDENDSYITNDNDEPVDGMFIVSEMI